MSDAEPQSGSAELPDVSLLRTAGALFAGWCLFLAVLALWTANPVQLNFAQLVRATAIVEARVVDLSSGECVAIRQWTPGPLPESLLISNLAATGAVPGESYVFPLVHDVAGDGGAFRVVDVPDREIPPLIYPAGAETDAVLTVWQGRTE